MAADQRDGDEPALAPGEGESVAGVLALQSQRQVVADGVELGLLAAEGEGAGQHPHLDRSADPVARRVALAAVVQQVLAHPPVDGAAVVGVDQAEVPQLGALVDVRHAGGGELHQELGQRVGVAGGRHAVDEVPQPVEERARAGGIEERVDEAQRLLLVAGVLVEPARALLALAQRLGEVAAHADVRLAAQRRERRLVAGLEPFRPDADQRLVERVLVLRVEGFRPDGGVQPAPAAHGLGPRLGHLGEDGEAGARVLAALGVVGGRTQHGVRPLGQPLGVHRVEGVRRDAARVGLAADLVEGEQAREAVEGGVLERLRHDGPGELLEARHPGLALGILVALDQRQHAVEGGGLLALEPGARGRDGALEDGTVGGAQRLVAPVGAVDREGDQELGDGGLGGLLRQVEQPVHLLGQDVELAREQLLEHEPLRPVDHRRKGIRLARHLGPQALQRVDALRVDQQAQHLVGELVAGGAGDRPVGGQPLLADQDLLDQDVEGLVGAGDVPQAVLQPVEVTLWIGEAVDVVDAQALDQAALDQVEDQRVRGLEHLRELDPEARQLADVEEAAVVAPLALAPEGQAVGLGVEQAPHRPLVDPLRVEALGTAGGEREGRVVVGEDEAALGLVALQLQLALAQDLVERGSQRGQDQLAVRVAIEVDVEEAGVTA